MRGSVGAKYTNYLYFKISKRWIRIKGRLLRDYLVYKTNKGKYLKSYKKEFSKNSLTLILYSKV